MRARDGSVRAYALVDDEDYELLNRYRWSLTAKGYAERNTYRGGVWRNIRMHRFLLGLKRGDPRQGDHVNGNRLDNRRSNLRICEARQQAQNVRRGRANGYPRGVDRLGDGCWQARCRVEGRSKYLGTFATMEKAAAEVVAFRRCWLPLAVS